MSAGHLRTEAWTYMVERSKRTTRSYSHALASSTAASFSPQPRRQIDSGLVCLIEKNL